MAEKKEYVKVHFLGNWYVTESTGDWNDVLSSVGAPNELGAGDKMNIEIVEMTDEEYNALGDFEGF